jgi:hypothetical protein
MILDYLRKPVRRTPDTSGIAWGAGEKNSPPVAVLGGVVAPLLVLLSAGWNITSGEVWLPPENDADLLDQWYVLDGLWPVLGAVVCKTGIAGILVAWYGLANVTRLEKCYTSVAIGSVVLMITGMITFLVGGLLS